LPLKGSKRETIEKIPKPLRHKTYSSKRQPEFGKTRVYAVYQKRWPIYSYNSEP
jgi:hypothetical protein